MNKSKVIELLKELETHKKQDKYSSFLLYNEEINFIIKLIKKELK